MNIDSTHSQLDYLPLKIMALHETNYALAGWTRMRINAIFVESISYMSDITMFMTDEFNLLDLPNRSAFLN